MHSIAIKVFSGLVKSSRHQNLDCGMDLLQRNTLMAIALYSFLIVEVYTVMC